MMNKVLSPKGKRSSTSSNSLYRHKSTVLSSSLFLSKPKYTNMSYDNKPRRNSCVTKNVKQGGNSTKSLQRIKQSLNIHNITNELANSATNFSRLKKVNENLNQVLCLMKNEISNSSDVNINEVDKRKNLSFFLNNTSVDNNTVDSSKITNNNNAIANNRKLDPDKLFEDMNLEEPEISSEEVEKEDEATEDDKKTEETTENPFTKIKFSFSDLTVEEQILLATFIKKDKQIALHSIMEDLLNVKKENILLKEMNKGLKDSVDDIKIEIERIRNESSDIKEKSKKEERTILNKEKEYKQKITTLSEENKKIINENKYLKEKLAKMILYQQKYIQTVSANLEDIDRIKQQLKNEFV